MTSLTALAGAALFLGVVTAAGSQVLVRRAVPRRLRSHQNGHGVLRLAPGPVRCRSHDDVARDLCEHASVVADSRRFFWIGRFRLGTPQRLDEVPEHQRVAHAEIPQHLQ